MRENTLKNINKIPVRTWRWLGVNDVSIEGCIPKAVTYNKTFISPDEIQGVTLQSVNNSVKVLPIINSGATDEGISSGLSEMVQKDYNSGVLLRVDEGVKTPKPIIIAYECDEENPVVVDYNSIIADENSELTVIIQYKSNEGKDFFHNGITNILAKKGSVVNLIKVQMMNDFSDNFDVNTAELEYGAKVNFISIELGGKNSVTKCITELKGENSEGSLKTVYLGDKDRSLDMNYCMKHIGRRTVSNIEIHGVLMDESRKIFKGTLDFQKGAVKSKGREGEYAILLSPKVVNKAVPILLCTEEDVEGAHAASAGKIDESKLFYLMSRGFSEKEAKKLIIEAAFNPVLDFIPAKEIREDILDLIKRRLLNG